MFDRYPVYTLDNDCQDCCKCVRHCPVKAIGVEDGRAKIIPGLCIVCGECVEVCPARVKTIRDDLAFVKDLLSAPNRPVYVSLAPSWVNEFPGVEESVMIKALVDLGFMGVSETDLGAEQVYAGLAELLEKEQKPRLLISSTCPSVVEYFEQYDHELLPCLTPIVSPLLAHCKLIKKHLGQRSKIVHIGPCIASKLEAENNPDLLYASLTFRDLRKWFEEAGIALKKGAPAEAEGYSFVPAKSKDGGQYCIEGGLIESLQAYGDFPDVNFISISGIEHIKETLKDLDPAKLKESVFVECSACPGSCINGPCADSSASLISRRMEVKRRKEEFAIKPVKRPEIILNETFKAKYHKTEGASEEKIREALSKLGKNDKEDELNCGGCGYDTCRAFAEAMIRGMTEPTMCVSWMREKAQKKSNALFRSMPSGVVIADSEMRIVECNQRFAELFGEEALAIYSASPGLKGVDISRIIPFTELFKKVVESDQDIRLDHYRYEDKLFEMVIFSIEPGETVGAVILDVTKRELRRDRIAKGANEVIQKNLSTVQEIACRLGEHMAETEILLRAIAEGYSDEDSYFTEGETFEE